MKNAIRKMKKNESKSAIAKRKAAKTQALVDSTEMMIKAMFGVDVKIVASVRNFYVVGDFPSRLEKSIDLMLEKGLNGDFVSETILRDDVKLSKVVSKLENYCAQG